MPARPNLNDHDAELRIKGHLYEIGEVNEQVIGGEQGLPMAVRGYHSTLANVASCSNNEVVDTVASYIKSYIQQREERPPNRKVRRTARSEVTKAGYPSTSYLNSA